MDKIRIVLWGAVGVLLWLNLITWQRDYPPVDSVAESAAIPTVAPTTVPTLPVTSSSSASVETVAAEAQTQPQTTIDTAPVAVGTKIHVVTDVLDLDIHTQGGDIVRADLLKYAVTQEQPENKIQLLSEEQGRLFVARSGLATSATAAPIYSSTATEFRLVEGQNELSIPLTYTSPEGVTITKMFTLKRGSYTLDVAYTINNNSAAPWQGASYVQLFRHDLPVKYSMLDASTIAYRGPAIYNGQAYRKLKVTDSEDSNYKASTTGGWMAALQHYFVVAAVPAQGQAYDYSLKVDSNHNYTLTYQGPLQTVAAGATSQLKETLFIGPKLQEQLVTAGPELNRTTDYGKLYIIAKPLFVVLEFVHQYVSNWGIAIVLTTLLIKLAFYRLTASSGRSMAKMRTLAPKMKSIQERYKDDREALGRATMELYKKEKINPVAGCLPMLIQIPFFMGFYWVLLESVELRQAPFFAWITDLSDRDPYFILPLIMGIANYAQFKMNPPPADPTQAKIMAFMPIMMTVMMAWFPSGLVLYWITNTVVSALQQWRINTLVAADSKHHTA